MSCRYTHTHTHTHTRESVVLQDKSIFARFSGFDDVPSLALSLSNPVHVVRCGVCEVVS